MSKSYAIYTDFAALVADREFAFENYTQLLKDTTDFEKEVHELRKENESLKKQLQTTQETKSKTK